MSGQIDAAFESGYQRLFSKGVPTSQERLQMVWVGLTQHSGPDSEDKLKLDRAFIQDSVNMHDWRHRASCFKGGKNFCRYKVPHKATSTTSVAPVFGTHALANGTRIPTTRIVGLDINLQKHAVFMFLTDSADDLTSIFLCNNCVKYVLDQKVSLYYGYPSIPFL